MAIHGGTHYVISASFTVSGAPAYLAADGTWTSSLQEAWPIADEAERDARLAGAAHQQQVVSDPYYFDARLEGAALDPLSTRERIRASGTPTVRVRRPDR